MSVKKSRQRGFTLVEIAIVLVIIALLMSGILNSRSVIRHAQTKDIIKAVGEIAIAAQQFHDRYGAWPGDLANAGAHIPNLSGCNGNGNGVVDNGGESDCASEELIRASMLRGDAGTPITIHGAVVLSLTNRTFAAALPGLATLPANWINLVHIQRIDCDSALQLDRGTDDGNLTTGNFRTGTVCAGQDENIPVDNAVLRLN